LHLFSSVHQFQNGGGLGHRRLEGLENTRIQLFLAYFVSVSALQLLNLRFLVLLKGVLLKNLRRLYYLGCVPSERSWRHRLAAVKNGESFLSDVRFRVETVAVLLYLWQQLRSSFVHESFDTNGRIVVGQV